MRGVRRARSRRGAARPHDQRRGRQLRSAGPVTMCAAGSRPWSSTRPPRGARAGISSCVILSMRHSVRSAASVHTYFVVPSGRNACRRRRWRVTSAPSSRRTGNHAYGNHGPWFRHAADTARRHRAPNRPLRPSAAATDQECRGGPITRNAREPRATLTNIAAYT